MPAVSDPNPNRNPGTLPPSSSAPTCDLSVLANSTPGEVRCPICLHIVPPEHIGYKLHCRRCGYLESCCNPV